MMNININKIKSFTLTEIIVVLLISTILVNAIYLVFQFSTKMIGKLNTITDKNSMELKIDYLLTKDFLETESLIIHNNSIQLRRKNKIIEYTFDSERIIRNALVIDTFHIPARIITRDSLYKKELKIYSIEIEYITNDQPIKKKYKTHL